MSDATKLDPRSLTAEERAIWDAFAREGVHHGDDWDSSYARNRDIAFAAIRERRALFGEPASEAEKAKCPNCGEMTSEPHIGKFIPGHWCCPKPAQPEPDHFCARLDGVGANVNAALLLHRNGEPDSAIASEIGKAMLALKELFEEIRERSPIVPPSPEPAAPVEDAAIQRSAITAARKYAASLDQPTTNEYHFRVDGFVAGVNWWRTHAQPAARVGMTEDIETLIYASADFVPHLMVCSPHDKLRAQNIRRAIAAVRETYGRKG